MKLKISIYPSVIANLLCSFQCETPCRHLSVLLPTSKKPLLSRYLIMKLERTWPYIYFLCLTIFFIPCLTFVGLRGYKCFIKYFNKPEAFKVSFQFSGNEYFPSLTFCSNREDTYNSDIFTECQVSLNDYTKMGPWVGKGSPSCTDPKILYDRAVIKMKSRDQDGSTKYIFQKVCL